MFRKDRKQTLYRKLLNFLDHFQKLLNVFLSIAEYLLRSCLKIAQDFCSWQQRCPIHAAKGGAFRERGAPTSGQLNVILQRRLRALIVAKHGGGEARAAKRRREMCTYQSAEVTVCAVTV